MSILLYRRIDWYYDFLSWYLMNDDIFFMAIWNQTGTFDDWELYFLYRINWPRDAILLLIFCVRVSEQFFDYSLQEVQIIIIITEWNAIGAPFMVCISSFTIETKHDGLHSWWEFGVYHEPLCWCPLYSAYIYMNDRNYISKSQHATSWTAVVFFVFLK